MSRSKPNCSYSVPPPVVSMPEFLPLNDRNLPWDRFETFCRDLLSRLPNTVHSYHYGKQGSKQRGIDIVVEREDGQRWVFQCKQYVKYSKLHVQKAIDVTTYPADKYHILISCEIGTPVRDVCKKAGWEIWDVRDISQEVRELEVDVARRLVDTHFGPMWRKEFLGLGGPSLFLTPQEFFKPWSISSHIFNHTWQLIGRRAILDRLHIFTNTSSLRVCLLLGRGGIGKSKILHAFAEEFQASHRERSLFFLDPNTPVTQESLEELPKRPCVLVVDDAHKDVEGLRQLFRLVCTHDVPIHLILSTRPYGQDTLRAQLRDAGFQHSAIDCPAELAQLKREDVEALARQALGPDYAGYAIKLAHMTQDCPLVTTVAGRLIAEKQLSPHLLANNDEFHYAVFARFEEEKVGRIGSALPHNQCRELLSIVSAVSPFRYTDNAYIDATAKLLNISPTELLTAFGDLEASGILIRFGNSLRITPDVLSDHIFQTASLTKQNRPTGFVRQMFDAFSTICQAQLLRNVSELAWRQQQPAGTEIDVLSAIWPEIEQNFQNAPNSGRYMIFEQLQGIAYFQPERIMALIETAISYPSTVPEDERIAGITWFSHDDVLRQLPPLLRHVAFTQAYLSRCCDLLWQLGCDDIHEQNFSSDHAIRVLQDLAEFEPNKPLEVNQTVLAAVQQWLQDPEVHNRRSSPLDILDALLRKEGHTIQLMGYQMSRSPYLISFEDTQELRKQTLHILHKCSRVSTHLASRVVQSLDKALDQPHGRFGFVVSVEEIESWAPEQSLILEMMKDIAAHASDPLVQIKVVEAIQWETRYAASAVVRDKAQDVVQSIPLSFELRLTRALLQIYDPIWLSDDGVPPTEAHIRHAQQEQQERESITTEFLMRYPNATDGARILHERIKAILAAKTEVQPSWFLNVMARRDVKYAAFISETIIDYPSSSLAPYLSCFLSAVRNEAPLHAISLTLKGVASNDVRLCRSIATIYAYYDWQEKLLPDEINLLQSLARHTDLQVRSHVIEAARILGPYDQEAAIEIALSVDISETVQLADSLCGCLTLCRYLSLNNLTDEQIASILNSLVNLPDIETYHICAFLSSAAKRLPREVVQLLIDRINLSERLNDNQYLPLPHVQYPISLQDVGESTEYVTLLRTVRDAIRGGSWRTRMAIPRLFRLISQDYSADSLAVLSEWIDTGNTETVEMAAGLLREAPRSFIFTHVPFVTDLVTRAHRINDDCGHHVNGYLFQSAISGSSISVPGQTELGDIQRRDMAHQAAGNLPPGSVAHKLYKAVERHFASSIRDSLARDEELAYE